MGDQAIIVIGQRPLVPLLTFPPPNDEECALVQDGQKVAAVLAYRKRAQVTLGNGHIGIPGLATAKRTLEFAAAGFPSLPVVVAEGNDTDLTEQEERDRVRNERFALFCAEDGLDPKRPLKAASGKCCDLCRKTSADGNPIAGFYQMAPDGMGYPTPVLFVCTPCGTAK